MKRVYITKSKPFLLLALGLVLAMSNINLEMLKVSVYPLFRAVQHGIISYQTREYQVKETEHFIIKYEKEDQKVIDLVAEASEKHYDEVSDLFNYYPKDKTLVIVYNDSQQLMRNANLKHGKPPMGVYYASTIQILSPRLWVPKDQDMEKIFLEEGPMVHEFTHLLVDDLTKGNYPLWFTEGLALYQEYVQTGYQWGKDVQFEGKPYSVQQLTEEFHELDEMLAYKQSFEVVRFMIENHGFDELNGVLKDLGRGEDFENLYREKFYQVVLKLYKE